MKRITLLSIIILVLLAGCNLPGRSTTPDSGAVATMVAATLNAGGITPAIPPTSAAGSTTIPTGAATPDLSTATLTPTITETPTQTITPTSTTDTSDPRNSLGSPSWKNTLDNGSAFGLGAGGYEDDYTRIGIGSGVMTLTSLTATGARGWRLTSQQPRNFYLEATFRTVSCSGADAYGLVFRAKDYSSGVGYYTNLTCGGNFGFSRWDTSATVSFLVSNTYSNFIQAGPGQTNRLGIMATDSHFRIYANGKLLQELDDSSFPNAGFIGVYTAGLTTAGATVELDEISLWNLP